MAKYSASDTTNWVACNLRKADGVLNVEILSDQVLRVSRQKYQPFVAGIVSVLKVEATTIDELTKSPYNVEIIANIPKESFWTGGALKLAASYEIATGGCGDLLRVIGLEDVRAHQSKEIEFIERSLRQHNRISSFDRVHDRLYRIIREDGLPDLTVAMLNEYELTADHIRTFRERYGTFSVAVITNPNGQPTGSAHEVALSMDVDILKWGPFLGRLNKR